MSRTYPASKPPAWQNMARWAAVSANRRRSIEAEAGHPIRAETDWVSKGFFDAAGIPRIAGRDFTSSDKPGSPLVVIINQSLAHELFGNANPLGRSIRFTQDKDARPFEIVGVVADSRYYEIHGAPQPAVWFTFQDAAPYMPTLHVRSSRVNTDAMAAAVRHELDALDKGFPIFNVKTLEVRIEESLARSAFWRISRVLLGSWRWRSPLWVSMESWRTRSRGELGRSVSGWRSGPVPAPYFGWWRARRFSLIGVGSLAGITLSVAGWRLLSERMPGVSPIDAQVAGCLRNDHADSCAAAVSIPAIRACRIDPLMALRHE